MKKALSFLTACSITVMCLPVTYPIYAAPVYEKVIAAEATAGVGGYRTDHGKTDIGFRVGGTETGVVSAYNDSAVCDGNNSKDVKAGFARFDLGDDISSITKYELKLSNGTIMNGRDGDINLYVALADAESTVCEGKTSVGAEWESFSWNDRPALITEIDEDTPDAVITPAQDAVIDVTELLEGVKGEVTIAVLGEAADAAGDMTYGSVQLIASSSEWSAPETGIRVDFTDESVLDGWIIEDGAESRFETDETVGNYMVMDGASAGTAPRTEDFESDPQMIVEFDMMIPSKKADGTTDNEIGGGNTGGIALMQGTTVAGVIGFRGDGNGNPSHALSKGGTSNDYLNALGGSRANTEFDKWLHYTLIVDTASKTGDIYTIDPETGNVYKHEGRFDSYISNISSLTNIGIVSDAGYSIAIANLNVSSAGASKLVISSEDNMDTQYIPGEGESSTVRYSASAYYDLTYNSNGGTETASDEAALLENKSISYSVTDSSGAEPDSEKINIDPSSGLLTIYSSAEEGDYNVTASCEGVSETVILHVKGDAPAAAVQVYGDEEILAGDTEKHVYTSLPIADTGVVLPSKETVWTIEGETLGCSIDNESGELTVGSTPGKITVKAEIAGDGVTGTLDVYIRDSFEGGIRIEGIILKNAEDGFGEDNEVLGIALDSESDYESVVVSIKALNRNNVVLAEKDYTVSNVEDGVQSIDFGLDEAMSLNKADRVRVKIFGGSGALISEKTDDLSEGVYKNIPLVSDWITGAQSGLGMGAGIMSPTGAPYGVDPDVVDLTNNISYTTDSNAPQPVSDNVLWYRQGAYRNGVSIYARDGADWEEQALPIGNGYMGGMIFGMPHKDQIQINEETFWAAGYRGTQEEVSPSTVNPNMSEGINGYMSVGNIFVDFYDMPRDAQAKNYYRDLNIDESVAHVQYEYDGVRYNREYFASYPKEVLVFRYTADTVNALDLNVDPVSMHPGKVTVKDGEITIVGRLKDSEPYSSGGNAAWNQESDLEYCTKVKVIADDGTVTDGLNQVNVSGATGVTIIVAAATDYDPDQFELNEDGSVNMEKTPYKSERGAAAAIEKAEKRISGAAAMTYDELKAEHIADYKAQFDTVEFSLTDADEICRIPTDELQVSYKRVVNAEKQANDTPSTDDDPTYVSYDEDAYEELDKHLEELHYNYARYLMISSSRSNTMPANLQGKWCQSTAEIWGSCYCININLEMNYWFAGGAGLIDSARSLVGWFESQIPAGRVTAKNMYGVTPKSYKLEDDGTITFTDSSEDADDVFIMHTKQAIMGTTDLTGSTNIQSAGNTAWLMYNLWDMYQTTGDKELLEEELYPIMRKAANFYTQYLYNNERKTTTDLEKYPDGYYYTTWAGRSPEHGPEQQEGIKYDLQLVAGMYDYTIAAAETLGVDADKVAAWKEIREHIELPVELGDDGQIKEWAQETAYNTDADGNALGDPVHRHISNLVGLYPGNLINRNTPEWLEGAKIVLKNRGDDATGWSCSNKFLLWARCLDGDKALELFRYQLAQKTYSNLFDTHAPFQIDGNFGSAAAVMELLMQSQTGDIYILPALPSVWDNGEISGIKAKNGAQVDIKWENNEATSFTVTPAADGDITIGYDRENGTFMLNGETYVDMRDGAKYTIEDAKAGTAYTFTATEAQGEDKPVITIADGKASVANAKEGILVIAGYDENKVLIKTETADGYEADLADYADCSEIKAFLWKDMESMEPLCDGASYEKN